MLLTKDFSAVVKKVRIAIAAVFTPLALGACTTTSLPQLQCMEGSSFTGPANLVTGQHIAYNDNCGNTMMNNTLIQVGNEQNDVGLIALGMTAQTLQNERLGIARDKVGNAIANPGGTMLCVAQAPVEGSSDVPLVCRTPLIMVPQQQQQPPTP